MAGDSAIAALVGSGSAARIFPIRLPQGEQRPSVVYHAVSGLGHPHMTGTSGLDRVRYQIDSIARHADLADELGRAVKDRLDGFAGTVEYGDTSPYPSVTFQGIFFDIRNDDYDNEMQLFIDRRDYFVWIEEE